MSVNYELLKQLHIALALLSVSSYAARFCRPALRTRLGRHQLTRAAPHVLDTLFLLTGIGLLLYLGLSPLSIPWVGAKLGGLVLYILLAMMSMRARTGSARLAGFVLALLVFAWIVSVARLKMPAGFFQLLA